MNIDWSKAPPHATHWCPGNAKIEAGWIYNPGGNGGEFYSCYADRGLEHIPEFPEWRKSRLVPRPSKASWTGEGLPPVGIGIDVVAGHELIKAVVLAHHRGRVVVADKNDDVYSVIPSRCRPAPTMQQIAAEAREKAIARMVLDIDVPTAIAARAYDAGYYKFEIVEEQP